MSNEASSPLVQVAREKVRRAAREMAQAKVSYDNAKLEYDMAKLALIDAELKERGK